MGIDSTYGFDRVKPVYPQIRIDSFIDELGILLGDLRKGNVTVCLKYKGKTLVSPIKIHMDLETLSTLARIQPYTFYVSKDEYYSIASADDLVNANIRWD